jgi:branched-chain amino acid transport system ATP-binding protein
MGLWSASSGQVLFDGHLIGGRAASPNSDPTQSGRTPSVSGEEFVVQKITGQDTASRKIEVARTPGRAAQLSTPEIARLGIAYVPENMGIFSDLSVSENILLAARAARSIDELDATRIQWLFGLFPALKKFWLYPAGKLSGGQKQMLAIARALVEPRRLLLIDEPSKGLAPAMVANLISALSELKQSRTTLLLVEQNFAMAKALGDVVAVMDDGRVVHRSLMAELAEDESLQKRLLGLSLAAHH